MRSRDALRAELNARGAAAERDARTETLEFNWELGGVGEHSLPTELSYDPNESVETELLELEFDWGGRGEVGCEEAPAMEGREPTCGRREVGRDEQVDYRVLEFEWDASAAVAGYRRGGAHHPDDEKDYRVHVDYDHFRACGSGGVSGCAGGCASEAAGNEASALLDQLAMQVGAIAASQSAEPDRLWM